MNPMTHRSYRLIIALVLALAMGPVLAEDAGAARPQVESSRLVGGTVTIATDGHVVAHDITTPELEPAIRAMIDRVVPKWRFAPVEVDGQVVEATVPMSLRVVANALGDGKVSVRIASTYFGADSRQHKRWAVKQGAIPRYPASLQRLRAGGTVYLVVRYGVDGRVLDIAADQVNLRVVGPEKRMAQWRADLAASAEKALRTWTFPPQEGTQLVGGAWVGAMTVNFVINDQTLQQTWDSYVPGPRAIIPWAADRRSAGSLDAMPDGAFQPLGEGPRLLEGSSG